MNATNIGCNSPNSSNDLANLSSNSITSIKKLKFSNPNKVFLGHLNVNSIRNKIESLADLIYVTFDIFLISETKIDNSFPDQQFDINGYRMFRKDRDKFGGGILFYVNENLPCKCLEDNLLDSNIEVIFLEIVLQNSKWLLAGCYKPPNMSDLYFIEKISNYINRFSKLYENFILIGDLNLTTKNKNFKEFLNAFDLKCLIKSPTCFQSANPSCIDHIITNKKELFTRSSVHEVGISDHHSLTCTMLNKKITKKEHKVLLYRDYTYFDSYSFQRKLNMALNNEINYCYDSFKENFMKTLDEYAPVKKKLLRHNQSPFMSKLLRKAIMTRSRLKNIYNKKRTFENLENYKKQRNFVVKLLRNTKYEYFNNMDVKNLTDNKKFWKTVKPFFNSKKQNSNKIFLSENGSILDRPKVVATTFNNYFVNITKTLELGFSTDSPDNFQNNISIMKINEHYQKFQEIFDFTPVTMEEVKCQILELNPQKSTIKNDIPIRVLKQFCEIYLPILTKIINTSLIQGKFPEALKIAEVTPIFKKSDCLNKENYRPISILSSVSKVFEKIMYAQINKFMENKFSKCLTGFRKGHSTQHTFMVMIEKWKNSLDKKNKVAALFMDLSKAFDTLNHGLLLAKLEAYGFSNFALKLMESYLTKRYQRTKVDKEYSPWSEIISGVPQGSILGPLLFNIFLNDIFLFPEKCYLSNYADDNTLYAIGNDMNEVNEKLSNDFQIIENWFQKNLMVLNSGKCHYMCFGSSDASNEFNFKGMVFESKEEQTILGLTIDEKLSFDSHIRKICKKGAQKLGALNRISSYLGPEKKRLIFNAVVKSQFSYCPLTWMFCTKTSNNLINKIHKRALQIIHNDMESSFEDLLVSNNEMTIHNSNIQKLMIEIFKIVNDISTPIMVDFFELRENSHNIRDFQALKNNRIKTVRYGQETISYRGPQLWSLLPTAIKSAENLILFKSKIKSWVASNCPCKICQTFIRGLGYVR